MVNSFFVYKPFEVDVSVYFVTMEKTEYRAVIKFFVLEGLSATEIHTKMVKVLKESAPSFPTVHRWVFRVLNVVVQALKMNHVVDVQKVQQHQKSLSKSLILFVKIQV